MKTTTIAAFALLLAALPAGAGDAHDHEHSSKFGGKVVESGHHHLEVVAKDGVLEVHVGGEDGKPEDISAAKATATVLSEGKAETIQLAPAGEALKGTGTFKAVKGTAIVITLTMPDHKPEQARVVLD
jgi:hypothetical protein